jgi:uncharacterized BrkB/YihY/UPF0761 family membrane protein
LLIATASAVSRRASASYPISDAATFRVAASVMSRSSAHALASALVVAVLWVYYSSRVFFFGACIGAAIHGRSGAKASP